MNPSPLFTFSLFKFWTRQCEAERVRLAIENESLKDRLVQRENTSTVGGSNAATTRHVNGRSLSCLTPPPGLTCLRYFPSSRPFTPCTSLDKVHQRSSVTPSPAAHAVRPGNDAGREGGSYLSGECRGNALSGLKFENVLCKGLHSGRVAAFAGGDTAALVVSQEFRAAGGSRGAMLRHGVTKVRSGSTEYSQKMFVLSSLVNAIFSWQEEIIRLPHYRLMLVLLEMLDVVNGKWTKSRTLSRRWTYSNLFTIATCTYLAIFLYFFVFSLFSISSFLFAALKLCFPTPSSFVNGETFQFSLADVRHQKNIILHREQVRDIKFSSQAGGSGYVLTTSFDRTLKVRGLTNTEA